MIHVPHYVGKSDIEGVGLFCPRDIYKGTIVYTFDWRFVIVLTEAEISQMPSTMRESVRKYSYRGKGLDRLTGAVYYCVDDARFINHSNNPNLVADRDAYIASCHIPANTEILCDYGDFSEPGDYAF